MMLTDRHRSEVSTILSEDKNLRLKADSKLPTWWVISLASSMRSLVKRVDLFFNSAFKWGSKAVSRLGFCMIVISGKEMI